MLRLLLDLGTKVIFEAVVAGFWKNEMALSIMGTCLNDSDTISRHSLLKAFTAALVVIGRSPYLAVGEVKPGSILNQLRFFIHEAYRVAKERKEELEEKKKVVQDQASKLVPALQQGTRNPDETMAYYYFLSRGEALIQNIAFWELFEKNGKDYRTDGNKAAHPAYRVTTRAPSAISAVQDACDKEAFELIFQLVTNNTPPNDSTKSITAPITKPENLVGAAKEAYFDNSVGRSFANTPMATPSSPPSVTSSRNLSFTAANIFSTSSIGSVGAGSPVTNVSHPSDGPWRKGSNAGSG